MNARPYAVTCKPDGEGRAQRLTPDGHLTTRKIRAAMFRSRESAERAVAELREKYPEDTFSVIPF